MRLLRSLETARPQRHALPLFTGSRLEVFMKGLRGFGVLAALALLTVLLAPGAASAASAFPQAGPLPPPNDALRRPAAVEKNIQAARAFPAGLDEARLL
jgi:hypothetical protein